MTNREKIIQLLTQNNKELDMKFFSLFLSDRSMFQRELKGYTSSNQAINEVLNQKFYNNVYEMMEDVKEDK